MDKKKLDKLEKKLSEHKKEILNDLRNESKSISELNREEDGDIVDHAFERIEKEKHFELSAVESRELSAINDALEKIKMKSFGLCEKCSKKISVARLDAVPHARNCIGCQNEMETMKRNAH